MDFMKVSVLRLNVKATQYWFPKLPASTTHFYD